MSGGVENYERCLIQHVCKLDLLDRYGLDVEFDDIANGYGRDGNGKVKDRFTVFNISVSYRSARVEKRKEGETISVFYKTGRFSIPVKNPPSSTILDVMNPYPVGYLWYALPPQRTPSTYLVQGLACSKTVARQLPQPTPPSLPALPHQLRTRDTLNPLVRTLVESEHLPT